MLATRPGKSDQASNQYTAKNQLNLGGILSSHTTRISQNSQASTQSIINRSQKGASFLHQRSETKSEHADFLESHHEASKQQMFS